ncbi:hypothetical protein RhiJN_26008 [Ceratobasidium sp. AG-Ba]|nr:hypothetical protein RhiJN_26008 [Ceratobasidium sp. AG-Ba]
MPQQLPRLNHPQGPMQPRWDQQPYPYPQPLDPCAANQYWKQQQIYPQNPHPPYPHTPSHMYNPLIPFSPVVAFPPPHTPLTSPISPTSLHPPAFGHPSSPVHTHAPTPSTSSAPTSTTIPLNPWGSTPSSVRPRAAITIKSPDGRPISFENVVPPSANSKIETAEERDERLAKEKEKKEEIKRQRKRRLKEEKDRIKREVEERMKASNQQNEQGNIDRERAEAEAWLAIEEAARLAAEERAGWKPKSLHVLTT